MNFKFLKGVMKIIGIFIVVVLIVNGVMIERRLKSELEIKKDQVVELKHLLNKEISYNLKTESRISEDALYRTLIELGVRFPHIVLAQARLETGNFSSKVFRRTNNLFGMKVAKQRLTTAKSGKGVYAYYDTWQLSVIDYALFQTSFLRGVDSEREYYNYLARNYAEDPKYVKKLQMLVKLINFDKNL
jgi:uncharacterized FlgJ-related protein